jgi:PPM family protein phosphatase
MSGAGQDRATARESRDGVVIALADGAGGTSNGAAAAQAVIDAIVVADDDSDWSSILARVDNAPSLAGGQTTAVVLALTSNGIVGASVGDSGAWIIRGAVIEEITAAQVRKPLMGNGCSPTSIHAGPLGDGTLLVASDGLLKYASQSAIAEIASRADLETAARALVELVRLPNGSLQDDVSLVLCRERY